MMLTLPEQARVAWITGAGRGIGRVAAASLAEAGFAVALTARSRGEIEEAASALAEQGHRVVAVTADVSDRAQQETAHAQIVEALGPVDVLVSNAGIAASAPFLKTSQQLWDQTLAVNLTGVFHSIQIALPGMIQRGWGRVIVVSSVAGKVGQAYTTAYCASKHGVIGLVRALALEVATRGVTVNAICPGFVDTPMTDATVANIAARTGRSEQDARAFINNLSPQKRVMSPEEIAALITYLATDQARGIHGQAINIDGGGTPW